MDSKTLVEIKNLLDNENFPNISSSCKFCNYINNIKRTTLKNSEIIKKIESSNARLFKESVLLEQMKLNNNIFKGLNQL